MMQKKLPRKILIPVVATLIPICIILLFWLADLIFNNNTGEVKYGVTFSPAYTESLGLDSTKVYQAILEELKVKDLRIPIYWSQVEKQPNQFDFQETGRMLDLAQKHNAKVILAIGYKVPRWPECFAPDWAADLDKPDFEDRVKILLEETIKHFKNRDEVVAWQVENEPLLDFGVCRKPDIPLLKKEVELVRSLDKRPVLITDSGELTNWVVPMQLSDRIGISLYRYGWDPIFGHHPYPFPALFYKLKQLIVKTIFANHAPQFYVAELQAEPWTAGTSIPNTPMEELIRLFNIDNFKKNLEYSYNAGSTETYLWGVEWWYWMKQQGHPEYWDFAKQLFSH